MAEDLIGMVETLDRGTLRGIRDRAMLLLGFAAGLRRSEIVGLDVGRDQTEDGCGWIESLDRAILLTLKSKNGVRQITIVRSASNTICPVIALETWLKFGKIVHGPVFRRVTNQGKSAGPDRLNDQEVTRLVKRTALAAGLRGNLPELERTMRFSGQSLRIGFVASADE